MNISRPRSPVAAGTVHPLVLERRLSDVALALLTALIPAVTALAVTIALPNASLLVILAIIACVVAVAALMVSSRLEVTVTLIVLFLGMLDGPVKLLFGAREFTASIQDVIIVAVVAGALVRIVVRKERVALPPLAGFVIAWVVLVLLNAFNPKTEGILHALGGFRQELQYVPFFFFGYYLIRTKRRFRQAFIIIGVCALANGVVAAYQTELEPTQLASWGPGYRELIHPTTGGTGRTYVVEGEARIRPPALGSEAGFSGAIGHIALPMCLALLAISRGRRRWIAALLCLGTIVAVIVGLGRTQLIGAGLGVVMFTLLIALNGRGVTRAVGSMLAIVALSIPTGAIVVSSLRSGTFQRYENINTSSETTLHKESSWNKVPKWIAADPLGFGLGNSGSVSGLGGSANQNLLEGHGLTSETEYNVLVKELGAPGLVLWPLIILYFTGIVLAGMRSIRDPELAICIAGMMASFAPLLIEGSTAFLTNSTASGPYYWLAAGVAAYWFAGPGRARSRAAIEARGGDADGALAPA